MTDTEAGTVRPDEEQLFTCAPGTALIFDNRILHGGGTNSTDEVRLSLQGFCCRSMVRPLCDHTRSTPRELVESATPLLRRLWGVECQCAWEESPREWRVVDAPGARPTFDYARGIEKSKA